MKVKYIIATIVVCVWMAACSKDKYNTRPHLDLQSLNGSSFVTGADIKFKFTVTDKEGDIQNTMWIQKISLVCGDTGSTPAPYPVPDFTGTKNLKVELDVNYTYGTQDGVYPPVYRCTQKDDSCYFKFWLKDKAGNISDTVTSQTITLLKD